MTESFQIYVERPVYDNRDGICGSRIKLFSGMTYMSSALPLKLASRLNLECEDDEAVFFVASQSPRGHLVRVGNSQSFPASAYDALPF